MRLDITIKRKNIDSLDLAKDKKRDEQRHDLILLQREVQVAREGVEISQQMM